MRLEIDQFLLYSVMKKVVSSDVETLIGAMYLNIVSSGYIINDFHFMVCINFIMSICTMGKKPICGVSGEYINSIKCDSSNKPAAVAKGDNQQKRTGKRLYRPHRDFMQKTLAENDPDKGGKGSAQDQWPLTRTDGTYLPG